MDQIEAQEMRSSKTSETPEIYPHAPSAKLTNPDDKQTESEEKVV